MIDIFAICAHEGHHQGDSRNMIKAGQKIVFQVTGNATTLGNCMLSKCKNVAKDYMVKKKKTFYKRKFPLGDKFSSGVRVASVQYKNEELKVRFDVLLHAVGMGMKFVESSGALYNLPGGVQTLCGIGVSCRFDDSEPAIFMTFELNDRAMGVDAVFEYLEFEKQKLQVQVAREAYNTVQEVHDMNKGKFRKYAPAGIYAPLLPESEVAQKIPMWSYNRYHENLRDAKRLSISLHAFAGDGLMSLMRSRKNENENPLSFELLCNLLQEIGILGVVR